LIRTKDYPKAGEERIEFSKARKSIGDFRFSNGDFRKSASRYAEAIRAIDKLPPDELSIKLRLNCAQAHLKMKDYSAAVFFQFLFDAFLARPAGA